MEPIADNEARAGSAHEDVEAVAAALRAAGLTATELQSRGSAVAVYSSKSDMVTASLREMIFTGQIEGGSQLRQRELATQLGVSPTPVREALRRLESEGLVVSGPHRSSTVVAGEFGATEENYRIRAGLESLAASLAAERISDDELAEIEAVNVQLAALDDDSHRRHALNADFHFRIYVSARSPLLLALLRLLWRAFPGGPQAVRPADESLAQHAELLQALRDHDEERAAQLTHDHIMGALAYLDAGDRSRKRSPRIV